MEGINEEAPYELIIASIVDRTHWTYQEIIDSPPWLIQTLLLKWSLESEHNKKQEK